MSVQRGPSASIAAFGELPESTQNQILANDAERTRRGYDLEEKGIDAEYREHDAQRAHERAEHAAERAHDLTKWERSQAQKETNDGRIFWFVIGALAVGVAGTVALFAWGYKDYAGHVLNTMIAGGLGYRAGKGTGILKSKRTRALPKGQRDEEEA
jgi:hypothetical protein